MNNDIADVKDRPFPLFNAFLQAQGIFEPLLDMLRKGIDVPVRRSGANHKIVAKIHGLAHIKDQDILGLLCGSQFSDKLRCFS